MALLNNSPNAVRFGDMMTTKTGRNALIGNADSFDDPRVKNALSNAHRMMDEGLKLVDRLTKDESRTDTSKHNRAKKAANEVGGALRDAHDRMVAVADEKDAEAEALVGEYLDLNAIHPFIIDRKFAWLREQWADPNGGSARIREQITRDPQLAAIAYRTDAYLIGIPDAQRMKYVEAGIKAHVPDADAKIGAATKLRAAAAKIPPIVTDVHNSFYNDAIAAKMATRVED